MKNAEELYRYCKLNAHTRNWIASKKLEASLCLRQVLPYCDGKFYSSRRIEFDYVTNLWLILENNCKERAYIDDVFIVVNRLFQDIANELTSEFFSRLPYKAVLRVRKYNETVLWFGPSQYAEGFLRVFLQSGYDAAIESL